MASGVFRGSKIAIDATVRAAATRRTQANVIQALSGRQIFREDLRYKLFSQKSGTLYILLIDASGSMAQNRIAHAKRVALGIFQRSYVDRDRVAIIAFAGTTAEILLRPSNSMARARRVLDALSVGGGTPLSAGLARSYELVQQLSKEGRAETFLMLFTDGGANVPLQSTATESRAERQKLIDNELALIGAKLRHARVSLVLVDTQQRFRSSASVSSLAARLGAKHVQMPGRVNS
jgi:magnesium chelatase subunit D